MAIGGHGRWTPGHLTASLEVWKVGKGWLMFMEAVAIKTPCSSILLPISSILIPTFEGRLKWYRFSHTSATPYLFLKGVLPGDIYLFFCKHKNLSSDFLTVQSIWRNNTSLETSMLWWKCVAYDRPGYQYLVLTPRHQTKRGGGMQLAHCCCCCSSYNQYSGWFGNVECGISDGVGGSAVAFSTTECLQLLDAHRINWDSSWSEGMHHLTETCSSTRTKDDCFTSYAKTDRLFINQVRIKLNK